MNRLAKALGARNPLPTGPRGSACRITATAMPKNEMPIAPAASSAGRCASW
jgi:hypothetical protein